MVIWRWIVSDISRVRGDTYRIRRTVKASGAVVDITDWTFLLTINRVAKPVDASDQIAQIAGVIFDATSGVVDFTPSEADVDVAGSYFYDIEAIDAGGETTTPGKGQFIISQDITKSDEEFEWTPDEAPNDDDVADLDGTVDIQGFTFLEAMVLDATYQTRDTRRVIRVTTIQPDGYSTSLLMPWGPVFPRQFFPTSGWEFKLTAYFDKAMCRLLAFGNQLYGSSEAVFNSTSGTAAATLGGGFVVDGESFYTAFAPDSISVGGWTEAEWIVLGLRWDTDGLCFGMVKREADADDWKLMGPDTWPATLPVIPIPGMTLMRKDPEDAESLVDIWKYEWRRL